MGQSYLKYSKWLIKGDHSNKIPHNSKLAACSEITINYVLFDQVGYVKGPFPG